MIIEQPWNDSRLKIDNFFFSAGSTEAADYIMAINKESLENAAKKDEIAADRIQTGE